MVTFEDLFSVTALFVTLRETIEASLIVAILLQMVVRLGRADLKKWVWWGVLSGVGVSLIIATAFLICFYAFKETVFADTAGEKIFEGVMCWLACIFVTILAFAMLRFMGWETKWERRLEAMTHQAIDAKDAGATDEELAVQAAEHEAERAAADRKDRWKIYLSIFLVVVREGIETVVFIMGIGNSKPSAIPIPALVGVLIGVAIGMALYYSGKMVRDFKWFFYCMCALLLLIAAGQVVNGMTELAEAGALGNPTVEEYEAAEEEGEPLAGVWYLRPLWDTSACCGAEPDENKFFALLHAIFGYQDTGTGLGIMLYCSYWIVVGGLFWWRWRNGTLFDADYKYNREQQQKQLEAELVGDSSILPEGIPPLSELKEVLADKDEGLDSKGSRSNSSDDVMGTDPLGQYTPPPPLAAEGSTTHLMPVPEGGTVARPATLPSFETTRSASTTVLLSKSS